MKVIGLTGNIGCGKSAVAAMLSRLGVAAIDADDVARRIRETDAGARRAIAKRFGTLEARELAAIVFSDAAALRDLESILHPLVRSEVLRQLDELERSGAGVVALEAIKLLESPLRSRCDAVWVVRCDERDAIERVTRTRGLTREQAIARLSRQSPQREKIAAADVVIDGSLPEDATARQVEAALARLAGG